MEINWHMYACIHMDVYIYIYIHYIIYIYEQGPPHPLPPSQMVPPLPPVAVGCPHTRKNWIEKIGPLKLWFWSLGCCAILAGKLQFKSIIPLVVGGPLQYIHIYIYTNKYISIYICIYISIVAMDVFATQPAPKLYNHSWARWHDSWGWVSYNPVLA